MAEENGKPKGDVTFAPRKESEVARPGLEKYALPGSWTEEDKRFVEFITEEHGGVHAE